jgi:hypothetical protein
MGNILFKTELHWGLETRNNCGLGYFWTPCHSVWVGESHQRCSWRGSDVGLLRNLSRQELGQWKVQWLMAIPSMVRSTSHHLRILAKAEYRACGYWSVKPVGAAYCLCTFSVQWDWKLLAQILRTKEFFKPPLSHRIGNCLMGSEALTEDSRCLLLHGFAARWIWEFQA